MCINEPSSLEVERECLHSNAGLSHLGMSELGQQLCEEGVVPSGLFELAFHGTL
jgi:hypothetical protein